MCGTNKSCHCGCPSSSLNEELSDVERFIKRVNLGPGLLVKFKGDPKEYVVKNVSADRQTVFVQPEPGRYATFNKKIKNIVAIQRKPVDFASTIQEELATYIKALEYLTSKKVRLV
jgi:hypothetical protein